MHPATSSPEKVAQVMLSPSSFLEYIEKHSKNSILMALFIFSLLVGIYMLACFTGGADHVMYVVLLLAGFIFGARGGVLVGIAAGIALGPLMLPGRETGWFREPLGWIFRTAIFALVGGFDGLVVDVLKKQIAQNQWLARHDRYSLLPNRTSLLEAIAVRGEHKDAGRGLLVTIGAEDLLEMGATVGLAVTDEVFRQMVDRIKGVLPPGTEVFNPQSWRLAFIVDVPCGPALQLLLDSISLAMKDPFVVGSASLHVDVEVGSVSLGSGRDYPDTILRKADIAASHARKSDRHCLSYDEKIDESSRLNLEILGSLREAMDDRQLHLVYQPKLSLATGDVVGAEALIRWKHPVLGELSPSSFIPRVEQSSLINPLTGWVIRTAAEELSRWLSLGLPIRLSVNISARNLLSSRFAEKVLSTLHSHGIDERRLELEITESGIMENPQLSVEVLKQLSDRGVAISIDDFGRGYSSLEYMSRIPATVLKIDKSFVGCAARDSGARHIIEASVRLGRAFKMETVAEGVDSPEVLDLVKDVGCDSAQGFWISPPLSPEEFLLWVKERKKVVLPGC